MSGARASSALSCIRADLQQSRGNRVVSHRSIDSCSPVRLHFQMPRDRQHHLSSRRTILNAFQQGGRLKSPTCNPCRLQDRGVRSVKGLKCVAPSALCVALPCGQVLKRCAPQVAPSVARRLYAARPTSHSCLLQSIPPTRALAELARKVTRSCFHSGVPANVDKSRRPITAAKSLRKVNSAGFRNGTLCRPCVLGPKNLGKVGSARSPIARDSAGDGGLADGWPAPRATIEEASIESEWLKAKLKQWLDDEYCPEPANEDISERCKRVYYRCLVEGVDDIGDILVEFIRDLETFSFKESFHGPFTAANAAIALIMERNDTQDG